MAHVGEIIEQPLTGERITFLETAATTGGDFLKISLEVAPGLQLLDTPGFPNAYRGTAEGARQALRLLQQETQLDWTMLSPSAVIAPGARSGRFRLGGDQLLKDAAGESRISVQDFAMAFIDEAETPAHSRKRFTVGY